uniref:Diaminopimelate decarboxylase n=1 Tax=Steinernema glaseri TaxID=37863 RepID=A0A1I7YB66_9BILA
MLVPNIAERSGLSIEEAALYPGQSGLAPVKEFSRIFTEEVMLQDGWCRDVYMHGGSTSFESFPTRLEDPAVHRRRKLL